MLENETFVLGGLVVDEVVESHEVSDLNPKGDKNTRWCLWDSILLYGQMLAQTPQPSETKVDDTQRAVI